MDAKGDMSLVLGQESHTPAASQVRQRAKLQEAQCDDILLHLRVANGMSTPRVNTERVSLSLDAYTSNGKTLSKKAKVRQRRVRLAQEMVHPSPLSLLRDSCRHALCLCCFPEPGA